MNHKCTGEGTIVACGEQAATPHGVGHGPLRAHQSIVIDIFPRHLEHGYWGGSYAHGGERNAVTGVEKNVCRRESGPNCRLGGNLRRRERTARAPRSGRRAYAPWI